MYLLRIFLLLLLFSCYKTDDDKKEKEAEKANNNTISHVKLLCSIDLKNTAIDKSSALKKNLDILRNRFNYSGFKNVSISIKEGKQFIVKLPDQYASSLKMIRFLLEKPGELSVRQLFKEWPDNIKPTNKEIEKLISDTKESLKNTLTFSVDDMDIQATLSDNNRKRRVEDLDKLISDAGGSLKTQFGAPEIKSDDLIAYPQYKRDEKTNELLFNKNTSAPGDPLVKRWLIVYTTHKSILSNCFSEANITKTNLNDHMLSVKFNKKKEQEILVFLKSNYRKKIVFLLDGNVISVAKNIIRGTRGIGESISTQYIWPKELEKVLPSVLTFGPLTGTIRFHEIMKIFGIHDRN